MHNHCRQTADSTFGVSPPSQSDIAFPSRRGDSLVKISCFSVLLSAICNIPARPALQLQSPNCCTTLQKKSQTGVCTKSLCLNAIRAYPQSRKNLLLRASANWTDCLWRADGGVEPLHKVTLRRGTDWVDSDWEDSMLERRER